MPGFRELTSALNRFDLQSRPVIVHASLRKLSLDRKGGPDALLDALLASVGPLVVPTFTYKTMVTPLVGPPNNGMLYGGDLDWLAGLLPQFKAEKPIAPPPQTSGKSESPNEGADQKDDNLAAKEDPAPGDLQRLADLLHAFGVHPRTDLPQQAADRTETIDPALALWQEFLSGDKPQMLREAHNRIPADKLREQKFDRVRNGLRSLMHGNLDHNEVAEPFHEDMPADPLMGFLPELVRQRRGARRTTHPILSFAGIYADAYLDAQTYFNPLGTIGALADAGGWVLLLGVDHTSNTAIHYGERLAGRRQFMRWARTPTRIRECSGFPGCSGGFQAILPEVVRYTRVAYADETEVQAVPLDRLLEAVKAAIKKDPLALLCEDKECLRCNAVRAAPF